MPTRAEVVQYLADLARTDMRGVMNILREVDGQDTGLVDWLDSEFFTAPLPAIVTPIFMTNPPPPVMYYDLTLTSVRKGYRVPVMKVLRSLFELNPLEVKHAIDHLPYALAEEFPLDQIETYRELIEGAGGIVSVIGHSETKTTIDMTFLRF